MFTTEKRQVLDWVLQTFIEYIRDGIVHMTIAQFEFGIVNWMNKLTQEKAIQILQSITNYPQRFWVGFSGIYHKEFYNSDVITVIPGEVQADYSMFYLGRS